MDFKRKHKAISTVNWLIGIAMLATICMPQNSTANAGYWETFTNYEVFTQHPKHSSGGSITMLETILRINTNNANETVEHISLVRLENGFVKNMSGCKNSACAINVKGFPNGTYKVIVKTNQATFMDTIHIP